MLLSPLMQVVVSAVETALITAVATFVVIQGVKEVMLVFGVDLSGVSAGVVSAIVVVIVTLLNGLLIQIPANLVPFAEELQKLLDLLIGALGPFGLYRTYKGIKSGK